MVLAIYPFDKSTRGRDVGGRRSPTGRFSQIGFKEGPFGWPETSVVFYGRRTSYVEIPNRKMLDAHNSITILAWIYHSGRSGPIINYNPGPRWGVHFWMTSPKNIFLRFVQRNGAMTSPLIGFNRVKQRAWTYIGATYNKKTGVAILWVNGRPVVRKNIGRITLATNAPIRLGAKIGDRRYFRGRIACVQFYSIALNARQIKQAKTRCFKGNIIKLSVPGYRYVT